MTARRNCARWFDEVSPRDVPAVIKARADTGVTAERIRAIVQQIYNHAIRNLLVTTNPAQPLRAHRSITIAN